MLAPSEDGGAPRAADVRALRGEITALKSEIRAREAFGGVRRGGAEEDGGGHGAERERGGGRRGG